MTSRVDRLAERFSTPTSAVPTDDDRPVTTAVPVAERWEDLNQRFTVWMPRALVAEAKAAAARRGESLAALVTRAVRADLGQDSER
jgi:hypothetical protein